MGKDFNLIFMGKSIEQLVFSVIAILFAFGVFEENVNLASISYFSSFNRCLLNVHNIPGSTISSDHKLLKGNDLYSYFIIP